MKKFLSAMLILLIVSGCSNEIENNQDQSLNEGNITNVEETTIKTLTATGFAGSSLNRISLSSNGNVYWVQYDGIGFEEENIVKNELIAKNAEDIEENLEEEIINIKGENLETVGELVINWITFNK